MAQSIGRSIMYLFLIVICFNFLSGSKLTETENELMKKLLEDIVDDYIQKNEDVRQLYLARPGNSEGEIKVHLQTTIKALKSCGTSCKFTVYYEAKDNSGVTHNIETTWANRTVDITGLSPGKKYSVWACMESFTDSMGHQHDRKCSKPRTVQATKLSSNLVTKNVQREENNIDKRNEGEVSLEINNDEEKKSLLDLLRKVLND